MFSNKHIMISLNGFNSIADLFQIREQLSFQFAGAAGRQRLSGSSVEALPSRSKYI
jgi:hypothetical protein